MFDRTTKLFLRWRDRGDAEALTAVFDRTAPELLRVALHLCGNVADAEDLVQVAFLAAIETAPRFDRSKRLMPWLVAILTHRAQSERRRQRRAPELGNETDVLAGVEDDPVRGAEQRELNHTTLAALDRLAEPYRQVTMLRLVHGLEPADIALLLHRSPGTVRAQVHRGIEQLRRLLPTSVAMALASSGHAAGRGLPAIKAAVLAKAKVLTASAASAATGATSTAVLTGLSMSKKLLFAAALLLCGVGVFQFTRRETAPAPAARTGSPTPPTESVRTALALAEAPTGPTEGLTTVRTAATSEQPGSWQLQARVVEAVTKQALAGATVDVHGPRSMTLLDLQREFGEFGTPGPTGLLNSSVEWLRGLPNESPNELPVEVTSGGARHDFLVRPAADTTPLASARTDRAGQFALPMPPGGGLLAVSFAGYGSRYLPMPSLPGEEPTIELWPRRQLVGFVRTERGQIPPVSLRLFLRGSTDAWLVDTDANGRFAVEIADRQVQVEARTPGWAVTRERRDYPKPGSTWICSNNLKVDEQGTIFVTQFGGTLLHVTDRTTGAAIETISLCTFDEVRWPLHCGRFTAPNGFFVLQREPPENGGLQLLPKNRDQMSSRAIATVWSEGYSAEQLGELPVFGEHPSVVEVQLQRGQLPQLTGHIVRGAKPVVGVRAQLRAFNPLNWQHNRRHIVAVQSSAADGTFTLSAPSGEYLFEVLEHDIELA
ncbi:MAG: sigma-70 family RNA polymerase sigma factor, partial [Planctomycetota bacterium]